MVSSEILSRYAFHSQPSPILALAVLDGNTKTEMFPLMLKHPAAGWLPYHQCGVGILGASHENKGLVSDLSETKQ